MRDFKVEELPPDVLPETSTAQDSEVTTGQVLVETTQSEVTMPEASTQNDVTTGEQTKADATSVSATENKQTTAIKKITAKRKALKVIWKKNQNVQGYQLQYALKKNFKGAKTIAVKNAATTSKTIGKLKVNRKYFVRIRTYIVSDGSRVYSQWSKAKSKKTK